MRRKAYVIHSDADEETASAVRRSLEEGGVRCSYAGGADPGNVERSSAKLIGGSDMVVLILSSRVNGSARVKREVERAVMADKPIIPFRVDMTPLPKYLELYLGAFHWLDASTPRLEQHLAQLVLTTRRLLGMEEGYASVAASLRGRRPAKKAVASAVFGVISIIVFGLILGPLSVILGSIELKAIAAGRSSPAGRVYARVGFVCGLIGTVTGAAIWFLMWYYDIKPPDFLTDLFG